ncbi:oligosaccharide flippase family protein [Vibrio parahaemolyticus]|uniref:Polysaccharide biosynthesis protein n=3 Tax=Vibrio harveyi group TaxID=717610 RepID=A0A5P5X687_VIBPH|nr:MULTISPECIES: oligosaccharide flippase family protein [Gammaproteobacteria]AYF18590.1 Membrane protein [Vibrio parahaemolyticus]EGQ8114680.1 oligosaccharide flippase family protein [Vibrio parahaemolyticus]EGQ9458111.1 oligosaccharide flippase family protein [Vibrio parahaemolyticus]EHK5109927.1 oligosaccharide flippase family protein [Vibrio parahaemolyticus]EIA1621129.1 oligosaccharide flippase family protein [Vibrio parahaemolyticus]
MLKKNKKELLSNVLSLGAIDFLGMLIPIITMPIITRAIGLELYGQYLLFVTMLTFGHTIIDYGVQYSGVRVAAKNRANKLALETAYADYQGLRFVLSGVFFLFSSLYVVNVFNSIWYLIPLFLYIFGYLLTSAWFFQGAALTKYLSIASISNKILLLIAIVVFIKSKDDFFLLVLFTTIPIFITSILLLFFLRSRYQIKLFSLNNIKRTVNDGLSVFIGLLAPNLYNAIPLMLLGNYADKLEFANFAISLKVCGVIFMLQNVVAKSIYPITSRNKNGFKPTLFLNLLIVIPCVLILFFFGSDLIKVILGVSLESDIYIKVISTSLIFVAISNSFSVGYFLPNNLDVEYRNIAIKTSILSAVIVFFLIYKFSVIGCALGLLTARAILFFNYTLSYKRIYNEKLS